ncbi:MAG: DUF2857 family protein [Kofleriaceae bacterium]|nr:DUF2857 family protein [Kofleriaceae bacterium]
MDLKQQVIRQILNSQQQVDLRPNEIVTISKLKLDLINIEFNEKPIDQFISDQSVVEPILLESTREQYRLICFLVDELEHHKDSQSKKHLSDTNIHKLLTLSCRQLTDLVNNAPEDIVTIKINHQNFKIAKLLMQKKRSHKETIDSLIKAGATKRFMYDEYGLSPKKYKFLRNAFQLDNAFGRPRVLTITESHWVYQIWQNNLNLSIGERYLLIFNELNKNASKKIFIRNIATAVDEISIQGIN